MDRPITKAKIYTYGRPSKRVRELFVAQVADIHWRFKLSPETINLPMHGGIHEIQVIELALRAPEVNLAVLQCIERAIPFPLLLQLRHGDNVCHSASYKRPSESDASKWVIEATFQSAWCPAPCELPALPVALDLASLYEQIFRRHIPLQPRESESLASQIARFNDIQNARKLKAQLQARLSQEVQFNRKVELNARLRELTNQLMELQR